MSDIATQCAMRVTSDFQEDPDSEENLALSLRPLTYFLQVKAAFRPLRTPIGLLIFRQAVLLFAGCSTPSAGELQSAVSYENLIHFPSMTRGALLVIIITIVLAMPNAEAAPPSLPRLHMSFFSSPRNLPVDRRSSLRPT